jgi:hypothetical protein
MVACFEVYLGEKKMKEGWMAAKQFHSPKMGCWRSAEKTMGLRDVQHLGHLGLPWLKMKHWRVS